MDNSEKVQADSLLTLLAGDLAKSTDERMRVLNLIQICAGLLPQAEVKASDTGLSLVVPMEMSSSELLILTVDLDVQPTH